MKPENLKNAIYVVLCKGMDEYDIVDWIEYYTKLSNDKKGYSLDYTTMLYKFLQRINQPDFMLYAYDTEYENYDKELNKSYGLLMNCRMKFKVLLRAFTQALDMLIANPKYHDDIMNFINNQIAYQNLTTNYFKDESPSYNEYIEDATGESELMNNAMNDLLDALDAQTVEENKQEELDFV